MTASAADTGFSATLGIHNGTTYDLVAEITSISPPGYSRDVEEVTHLNSDNGYKEFIASLKEMTDCTFSINYVPGTITALVAAFEAGAGQFQITAPSDETITFPAIVTALSFGDVTPEGKMTAEVTLKPTTKAVRA